ncbi:MAG: ABC transporter substrate-binding protein [Ardenticatenaceae bacterium]|nr:ABC transporter substrate-binding protein [Ardenticatenaceae bacterium]MCB9443453.1 ABC transporter substrate-binding protein [Ardenticatenaceae bacterium]
MKRFQQLIVFLLVLVFALSACQTTDTPTEEPTAPEATAPAAEAAPAEEAAPEAPAQSDIVLNVAPAGQATTTFTYNFNPFSTTYMFPTWSGIYEPLMINNRIAGELTPWLAESYEWSSDNLTLTFHIREGVKWSDNTDFTSADVVFTFDTLKNVPGLAGMGLVAVQEGGYVDSVSAPDAMTVEFHFNRVYTPGFYDVIAQQIVPEHIWKDVADPVTETNLTPVGTGPFTEVVSMQDQSYEVDRNPYYWQPGQPYVKGLRMPAFSGNDTSATMFVTGELDWTGQFFNNVDQAVLANNPDAACWWPAVTSDQFFMVNGTIPPFDDPIVRKAISMSFDREQLIQLALQGKSSPSDITGLSGGYAFWKAEDLSTLGDNWTIQDVEKANQMLDEAGYAKGADGIRTMEDGTPFDFELVMVNGFSDWLAMAPTLQANLESIGFKITINNYDPGQFFGKLFVGDLQMSLYFGIDADTPYVYYRNIMSSETFKPIGEETGFGQNMWRVVVPEAEAPLQKFASTGDLEVQKEAALELQQIFADNAPVIPLFHAPTFYCYSNAKVSGWANEADPFVRPMPIGQNASAEQLIQMVSWGPKE